MAAKTDGNVLKVKEKVVAVRSMPGVPEGTRGKVFMVAGFDWIRYWVRFENGQARGSIHRNKLARLRDWEEIQARRARGEADTDEVAGVAAAEDGEATAEGGGGEGVTYAGVVIPGNLIERSKNRRQLLGK